ncbi:MAG: BufA2 family periplasmic bufferin-type metallophore [Rudaea sp.]
MKASAIKSLALAAAVASLFAISTANAANAAGDQAQVKCTHSSACKGQGACKSKANSCKGQNSCKGHGFTMQKDQAACKAAQEAAKAK